LCKKLKGKSEDVALPRGLQDKGAERARHLAHREPNNTKNSKYCFDNVFTLVLISMMKKGKRYASVYLRH
jgi:hypothetical protein